ncbi:hypothetical protein [Streptomyces sp. NPDC003710]
MGLGVDAGPVPVGEGVLGVVEDGFLVGPGLEVGLVGPGVEEVLPGVLAAARGAGPPLVVEGGVGEVGMAELPSGRPPVPLGE